ncbi:MAG TPA: hypothetical protein VFZ53_34450 [Polyangiaceae bacterium]
MHRRSSARFFCELAACALALAWVGSCSAKSAVVCDKLEGCGLLRGSAEDCVETIRKGFADDGVDGEKLTKCIDCFGVKYCSELERGLCEEDCSEVLQQLRRRGILPGDDRGEGGAGGDGGGENGAQ